jgi:hypothetical protein
LGLVVPGRTSAAVWAPKFINFKFFKIKIDNQFVLDFLLEKSKDNNYYHNFLRLFYSALNIFDNLSLSFSGFGNKY